MKDNPQYKYSQEMFRRYGKDEKCFGTAGKIQELHSH
jgi:hypothetical protein